MLAEKLSGASADKIFSDDVFSSFCYTGNGSTQTIANGIDLAGKGGMVWCKSRSSALNHEVFDTARGGAAELIPSGTFASQSYGPHSFNSNGFSLGSVGNANTNAVTHASWTFRKAPKFFDVVTYTGNGVANRAIPHNLGVAPGMVIVKRLDNLAGASDWQVYHRSITATDYLVLNSTASKATSISRWNNTDPTASVFTLHADFTVNGSGGSYVAYLFAHDSSADGIVQCGSFTTTTGFTNVTLGWEPQYLLFKKTDTAGDSWHIFDQSRGFNLTGSLELSANTTNIDSNCSGNILPTATGFSINGTFFAAGSWVYLAIRRPNKPPTTGTQVYNAIARTGTGAAATVTGVGFAPDLVMTGFRNAINGNSSCVIDRLRGANKYLLSNTTISEDGYGALANLVTSFDMTGITLGADINLGSVNRGTPSAGTYVDWFFRRAPGVMDVVCFTGTPSAVPHSLGVVPELMIQKKRGVASDWYVTYGTPASASNATLQSTAAGTAFGNISASQTSSTFYSIWGMDSVVAYLFATKAGISKVGSYTGNGTSQTIDCGFTTGARFVLIKATSTTGDWLVGDSTRGLVAGNDPRLSLNTTAAEVTTEDWLDPHSSGFIVNQVAGSSANASGVSYIVLAFA